MSDDHDSLSQHDPDISDAEREALHELQLGIEHVYRGYGTLLTFHHQVGHAMDHLANAEAYLREAGHKEWANILRDHHLPAGAVDDQWTYELVQAFREGLLQDVADFEHDVRDDLVDGLDHVTERQQQSQWRERAGWDE
ncbi:hypothetical protein C499_10364 [Halogeometricum borinquense DSM 11551]|uniref:Uncharacterized protein n=2 Tax=Halogeometricum borinquense TaxID=60847 RepID=E4NLE7_HALBP|nr:hypothetical protein [Halogeometricum borinquense]ADQ66043.1 hypothetical protein Hbor_04390 [Halogeometricum borinquense DSM 11551]ELY27460.1 hypothetical protein C499_10364 [Halogeometricum borinquense DSM 11551]RYJ13783.1 hypothetical protein ELS19_07265 [Halogeometricum borinquense]